MKWSIIKYVSLFAFLFVAEVAEGRELKNSKDIPAGLTAEERRQLRHERRISNYQSAWGKLIPRYGKLQYAGSMGFLSGGIGWDYGKRKQWETDFLMGFVPRFSSNKAKATLTFKQNYIPWEIPVRPRWSVEPLTTGIYMNTILADDFWGKEPERYPNNYYKFSTRIRFHFFLGQRIVFVPNPKIPSHTLTFFYEFSSCELYMISAIGNKAIKASDIVSLSFGLKFQFL